MDNRRGPTVFELLIVVAVAGVSALLIAVLSQLAGTW